MPWRSSTATRASTTQAWQAFEALIAQHPDYTAAYLHAGNALVALGRREQARAVWQKGVEACAAKGDTHARGELEAALARLKRRRSGNWRAVTRSTRIASFTGTFFVPAVSSQVHLTFFRLDL